MCDTHDLLICLCVCSLSLAHTHTPNRLQPSFVSVVQCVAVRRSVLQCVAVCCSALQRAAVCCGVLQCIHKKDSVLFSNDMALFLKMVPRVYAATHCKHTAAHCSTLQHTATRYNTLQHTQTPLFKETIPKHNAFFWQTSWHFGHVSDLSLTPTSRRLEPSFCDVLQCVAVCCSLLQCVAVCCSVYTESTQITPHYHPIQASAQ